MTLKTQQRFKADNGLTYFCVGSGSPIVLIHGVGLRAEAWLHQVSVLSERHTVYAVDMPGHGESDLNAAASMTLAGYVDAIASLVNSDIKAPVIIIGHSMGSMIALNFASRYAELCRGVVALNAVYRRPEAAKQAVQQRARKMIENPALDRVSAPISRWFNTDPQGFELEMAELCRHWLSIAPAAGYAQAYQIFSQEDGPLDEELAALTVPAMFITGDGDSNSSGEMSRQMAERCPDGRYAVIKDSRHMVQMTHPGDINSLLTEFTAQCETHARTTA